MEVHQTHDEIFLFQAKYARDMLKTFGMSECKHVATLIAHGELLCSDDGDEKVNKIEYKSIMGSLRFLCNTRPNICYDVSLCTRYMANPSCLHLKETKRILRSVCGTVDFGIHYFYTDNVKLVGFSDSDWGSNIDDQKSNSGNYFSLGTSLIT